jgi:transposase
LAHGLRSRPSRTGRPWPARTCTHRNPVERLWARLKEWGAIATRYETTANSFMGVLCLAAAIDWIKW